MVTCNWTPHSEGGERSLVHLFLGEHVGLLLVDHIEHVHLFLVKGRAPPPAWLAVDHGGEDEQEEKSGKSHLQGLLQEYWWTRQAKHIVLLHFSILWLLKQMKVNTVSQAKTLRLVYEHPKLRHIKIQLWLELHPPSPEI